MKIILLQNVKNLGKAGEIKEVSDGFARNFLFPKKIAEVATPEAIRKIEAEQVKNAETNKEETERLQKLASALGDKKVLIEAKAKKGKLFGSITAREIVQELKKENFDIDEDSIILPKAIKEIGDREVEINLGKNIKTKISVSVREK